MDVIFEKTDRLLSAGDFEACDEYLLELVHSDDLDIVLSGLTSTWAAWPYLKNRDALIGRVRSLDTRPGLVDGLIPERPDDIKDEAEYQAALRRLDEVWGVSEGHPDWEESRSLLDRIVIYEDQNFYIPEPSAEAAAQFRREQENDEVL
jgi:hypothetical protein